MKIHISKNYKEEAKKIRTYLRNSYMDWKFSVRSDSRGIDVFIIEAPYDVFDYDESDAKWRISKKELYSSGKLTMTRDFIPEEWMSERALDDLRNIKKMVSIYTDGSFYFMLGTKNEPLKIRGKENAWD